MIIVTEAATKQINLSKQQGNIESDLGLRIDATQSEDGHIHYQMGFDNQQEGDLVISGDVALLVSAKSQPLVNGMTLDYVEMEDNNFQFIFMNPNDPNYVPPQA